MFFRANVFQVKLDNILFNIYQPIKFLRLCLYLQNPKINEK